MSRNLDDILGTKTCEPCGEYVRATGDSSSEKTPTTPLQSDVQARHVVVGRESQSVVIYYDAAAENDLSVRNKIAQLLKR